VKIIECTFPDCDEVLEYEEGINNFNFECPKGHKFCGKCKQNSWHEEHFCNTYEEFILNKIKENPNSENFKQCPNCNVIIEKNEGCNQITCIHCQFIFCWLCLRECDDGHYDIYNFRGCPGMKHYNRKKISPFNNNLLLCLWYFFSCILGSLAILIIFVLFLFIGCPYELIKYYLEHRNDKDEDDEDYIYDSPRRDNQRGSPQIKGGPQNVENLDECNCYTIFICIILGIVGLALQPIYLLFYILYAMMECYRRFACWYYYV